MRSNQSLWYLKKLSCCLSLIAKWTFKLNSKVWNFFSLRKFIGAIFGSDSSLKFLHFMISNSRILQIFEKSFRNHKYLETSTLADQNIFFRNNYIFKCDSTSIGTALAHIEFFATRGDPGGVSVYNESCEKK